MKGVLIHGGLLAVMLIYGYRTWTKTDAAKPTTGEVVMWTRGESDLKSIELTSEKRTVKIERRGEGASAYWWGSERKQTQKPNPPKTPAIPAVPDDPATPVDESKPAVPAVPADEPFTSETVTTEFPIGPEGEKLVKQYARMRAIKGIGVPSDAAKKDYGLDVSETSVVAMFADGSKTLVVGGKVFGGGDRYLQDLDTNKVFVVLGTMVSLLEGGEMSLRPTELRAFDPKAPQQIEIAAGGKTKTVARIKVKPPAPDDADPHKPPAPASDELVDAWGQGQTEDTTAANFIDKLEKLRPSSYDPKTTLDSLETVAALTYKDRGGKQLGTLKLLRRSKAATPGPDGTTPTAAQYEYFVWTERTRVPAPVSSMQAERVEQDVATLFAAP